MGQGFHSVSRGMFEGTRVEKRGHGERLDRGTNWSMRHESRKERPKKEKAEILTRTVGARGRRERSVVRDGLMIKRIWPIQSEAEGKYKGKPAVCLYQLRVPSYIT